MFGKQKEGDRNGDRYQVSLPKLQKGGFCIYEAKTLFHGIPTDTMPNL